MNGTVGEVPPSGCDGNTKTGSPFGPLIYTLRIMGNQATLINAAGSSAGAVVATGTINGNSLTLSNNGPLPASGLRFASFNGTVNGNTISGSGTFQGSQQPCVIPFDFTANTNAPVS
jgi:hypothetical protein